jgi:hypothetical protein
VIETKESTDELQAAWREAQGVVNRLRLDAPGRAKAEDRLHDARNALYDRLDELERIGAETERTD